MNDHKQYTWELSKDVDIWHNEIFDSVEECIEDAKESGEVKDGDMIYIGEAIPYEFEVSAEDVLIRLEEDANWAAGDWPWYERGEKLDDLSVALTECVKSWIKENNNLPTFYTIEDIKKVVVK